MRPQGSSKAHKTLTPCDGGLVLRASIVLLIWDERQLSWKLGNDRLLWGGSANALQAAWLVIAPLLSSIFSPRGFLGELLASPREHCLVLVVSTLAIGIHKSSGLDNIGSAKRSKQIECLDKVAKVKCGMKPLSVSRHQGNMIIMNWLITLKLPKLQRLDHSEATKATKANASFVY
jgi:hypothetical protein